MICGTFDFNSKKSKGKLWEAMRKLNGLQRIEIKRYFRRRSDQQNRYYWGVHVELFRQWISENWGQEYDADTAHDILKRTLLGVQKKSIVSVETGEEKEVELPPSTATLNTADFTEYLDRVTELLVHYCGIEVPTPETFYGSESKRN